MLKKLWCNIKNLLYNIKKREIYIYFVLNLWTHLYRNIVWKNNKLIFLIKEEQKDILILSLNWITSSLSHRWCHWTVNLNGNLSTIESRALQQNVLCVTLIRFQRINSRHAIEAQGHVNARAHQVMSFISNWCNFFLILCCKIFPASADDAKRVQLASRFRNEESFLSSQKYFFFNFAFHLFLPSPAGKKLDKNKSFLYRFEEVSER